MLEFKLQYYFEKYKDALVLSIPKFKVIFTKNEGEFPLINELVIMIQKYQYKKYGNLIGTGKSTYRRTNKGAYTLDESRRMYRRFGSKQERDIRKRRYDNER